MKRCIVSYYPTTNEIHNIYDSVEDAKEDVKMCNIFNKGHEKLSIGKAELTDEEYQEYLSEDNMICTSLQKVRVKNESRTAI